jgi:mannitol/fructose-specific phosphotransferase system IIA component (Ntr-type)
MVLVARSQYQWNSIKQIFAIIPPYAEMHEGFSAAQHCLNRLAEASYATVCAVVQQGSSLATHSIGQKTLTFSSWRNIPELLKPISGVSHASVVILSARPSEQSWNPAFERLPHMLAENFGQVNVLMIYMPSPSKKESSIAPGGDESLEHEGSQPGIESATDQSSAILMESIRSGKLHVNMQSSAIAEAVYELIFSALPHVDKKDLRALADRCIDVLQKQPIEIEPGVVLLHDRIETIQYPSVCFGAHKKGFRLSALEDPVQIIVLILVPKNQNPEDHLRFLASIASMFRTKNLRERMLAANSPEELLA